ncbi:MAG: YceI family protein [Pirellulaceae bacterium]
MRFGFAVLLWMGICPALFAETYEVDAVHSSVMFRVTHTEISYIYGMFKETSGTFSLDNAESVDVKIAVASIETGNEGRDKHLLSPDYFSAKQFPEIRFQGKSIQPTTDGVEVSGELTVKGVTKRATITIKEIGKGQGRSGDSRMGVEALFAIKRSDFGVGGPQGLSDRVRLYVSLQGVKK